MRIEKLVFHIFLLVDKTRQIEETNTEKTTDSTLREGVKTGSSNPNSLSRPELRRLVNKWKWSQPSYQGEQTFLKIPDYKFLVKLHLFYIQLFFL